MVKQPLSIVVVLLIALASWNCSDAGPSTDAGINDILAGDSQVATDSASAVDTVTPQGDTGNSQADALGPQPDTSTPPSDTAEPPSSALVDPSCADGKYTETLPDPTADISAEIAGYSSNDPLSFIQAVLEKRTKVGAHLVAGGLKHQNIGDCVKLFLGDTSTPQAVIKQMSVLVHECGHFYDLGESGFSGSTFVITPELTVTCQGGNKFEYGGKTFTRDKLMGDTFAEKYPACPPGSFGGDCDFYATTYLTGSSGDQGFNMLFEEVVQYVNSLMTGYSFNDYYAGATSERDGILTFLWYMERYLYLARTEYPEVHAFLLNDACWRNTMLKVWGRAWLYLEVTKPYAALGINDDKIQALVEDPVLLNEIELLREKEGCP